LNKLELACNLQQNFSALSFEESASIFSFELEVIREVFLLFQKLPKK